MNAPYASNKNDHVSGEQADAVSSVDAGVINIAQLTFDSLGPASEASRLSSFGRENSHPEINRAGQAEHANTHRCATAGEVQ